VVQIKSNTFRKDWLHRY